MQIEPNPFKVKIDSVFNILEKIVNCIYVLQKNRTHIKVLLFYPANVTSVDKIIMFYIISFEKNYKSIYSSSGNIFYFEILTNKLTSILAPEQKHDVD